MISRLIFEKSGPFLFLLKEIVASMNYNSPQSIYLLFRLVMFYSFQICYDLLRLPGIILVLLFLCYERFETNSSMVPPSISQTFHDFP